MENHLFKLLVSPLRYHYQTKLLPGSVRETIAAKRNARSGFLSRKRYTGFSQQNSSELGYIVNGYGTLIKVTCNIQVVEGITKISLEFKPTLSPLFIVGPVLLFLIPTISRAASSEKSGALMFIMFWLSLMVASVLLISYVPIQNERRK